MRAFGGWLAAAVATVMMTAGCIGEPLDPAASEVQIVTAPDDYSYLEREVASPDQRAHLHDYWGGRDSLTVLAAEEFAGWVMNGLSVSGGGYYVFDFAPPDGTVVPLGTERVEITVKYEDRRPSSYGQPELWVRTAADSEYRSIAQVNSGDTVVFESQNAWNDIPHQQLSAWSFGLALPREPGTPGRTFETTVNMTAVAHRGLEIPLFPAHPDHWDGATELPLVAEARGNTLMWVATPPDCLYCSGGIYQVAPDDGVIVPPDTTFVRVEMAYSKATATGLRLLYHGADTSEWREAIIESDDGSTRVHRIDVDRDGDGPYALQSMWRFYFDFETENPGGVGPYSGSWSLSATAFKEA